MTTTGKKARRRFGTRAAAKRGKARKGKRGPFGKLPVSEKAGNARPWREGR